MSKIEQLSFTNVISVNPYKNTYVSSVSSFLNETVSPVYTKDQYSISYLNTKDFINSHISLSKNIPDEDLYDAIYNKAYDELGLDQAVEYHIQYIESFNKLDENNRDFHVFIIDPIVVDDTFKNTIEKIKYIDYIIPSPLLIKSLYSKEIIEDSGVHCFLYFQENDTFIAIYDRKDFIYMKSLNYSFLQMHDRFCEIFGERIEYEDFINFVSNENLKITSSRYKESFIKLYKEIFANVSDILTYVKRALDIKIIDHIYIDTQLQTVSKLDEIAEVELSVKSSNFNFNYGFESANEHIDHIHSLMHLYTTTNTEEKYECNFTTYHRPPAFIKRESGRVILLAIASIVLAFIYPISYWTLTYAQSVQYNLLEEEYREVHNTKTTREAIIKNKEADKHKTSALLDKEKQEYVEKKNTLIKIHDVKVNYPMKANLLYKLSKDINKYQVKLETVLYSEKETKKQLQLGLVSSKDKKITDLIKYLTKTYEGKFSFSIEEISYTEESKLYFGELKVNLL
ncbi:hypothetical protein [Candidatus Sulfurimonas baltica]|uniref:Uncharacterized protein n=1 Tax=Candidatus Sulfurimonas baltica TaxID=2740404 RepID=A0A7S7LWT8_9BACT|nr:hypothetical protein [Candidatus Sulfurimonas baltica]QOY52821.1 hypothetical protein HUE88_03800 [Candidatus Sulfurimonas baltica]